MFCTSCGRPDPDEHETCRRRAPYEPPRFCPDCARRMVVQVLPTGWRARCSEHGTTTSR